MGRIQSFLSQDCLGQQFWINSARQIMKTTLMMMLIILYKQNVEIKNLLQKQLMCVTPLPMMF
jgi:hypothetical protein